MSADKDGYMICGRCLFFDNGGCLDRGYKLTSEEFSCAAFRWRPVEYLKYHGQVAIKSVEGGWIITVTSDDRSTQEWKYKDEGPFLSELIEKMEHPVFSLAAHKGRFREGKEKSDVKHEGAG
jgi:hypothetical protein